MANTTDPFAQSVHGTNPQYLIEKITRLKIYNSVYWKEQCFGLTAETIMDKAVALKYCGGTYGGNLKPTNFLCLVLKLLQLQPEIEIVIEFIKNEDFKYLRALGAFYLRLVGKVDMIYQYLEPLLNDYRKLSYRGMSGWMSLHMDEFVDSLLRDELVCDMALPHLVKRMKLEEQNLLLPRKSALDDEIAAACESSSEDSDSDEEEEPDDRQADDVSIEQISVLPKADANGAAASLQSQDHKLSADNHRSQHTNDHKSEERFRGRESEHHNGSNRADEDRKGSDRRDDNRRDSRDRRDRDRRSRSPYRSDRRGRDDSRDRRRSRSPDRRDGGRDRDRDRRRDSLDRHRDDRSKRRRSPSRSSGSGSDSDGSDRRHRGNDRHRDSGRDRHRRRDDSRDRRDRRSRERGARDSRDRRDGRDKRSRRSPSRSRTPPRRRDDRDNRDERSDDHRRDRDDRDDRDRSEDRHHKRAKTEDSERTTAVEDDIPVASSAVADDGAAAKAKEKAARKFDKMFGKGKPQASGFSKAASSSGPASSSSSSAGASRGVGSGGGGKEVVNTKGEKVVITASEGSVEYWNQMREALGLKKLK